MNEPIEDCPFCRNTQVMSHAGEANHACMLCTDQKLTRVRLPTPPMLVDMIGAGLPERQSCFFALYYQGTCATWDDGLGGSSFAFFPVYQPLVDHAAVQIALLEQGSDATFGCDDVEPTHWLLCDRKGEMYVGKRINVNRFLAVMNPRSRLGLLDITAVDLENLTLEKFHAIGMFELFGGMHSRLDETAALLAFLNQYVNQDLKARYAALMELN